MISSAAAAWYFFVREDSKPKTVETKTTEVKVVEKKKYYAPLTGTEVADEAATTQQVTGVMIENSPQARPQSGLVEAGTVVEAIAEGGITRFAAFYQDTTAASIGPVRSARPYYVNFALGFDASYAHVGGSPDALSDIRTLGVKDMDQFFNAAAYERITSRYAPHNVYTSSEKLRALEQSKGYTKSAFTPIERKQDVPQTPTASTIDISISSPLYSPRFTYDPTTNSYKRDQAGAPHVDSQGKQIMPKVVVVLITSQGLDADGSHTTYQTVGSGKLYVFQDGIVSEGTWSKADRKASLQLTDKNGLPMKLNRGQTWISLVGQASDVLYKP